MPAALRRGGTELFEKFSARYDRYVEQVVVPTVAAFRSCTALVVLVDVTMLLAGGVVLAVVQALSWPVRLLFGFLFR